MVLLDLTTLKLSSSCFYHHSHYSPFAPCVLISCYLKSFLCFLLLYYSLCFLQNTALKKYLLTIHKSHRGKLLLIVLLGWLGKYREMGRKKKNEMFVVHTGNFIVQMSWLEKAVCVCRDCTVSTALCAPDSTVVLKWRRTWLKICTSYSLLSPNKLCLLYLSQLLSSQTGTKKSTKH